MISGMNTENIYVYSKLLITQFIVSSRTFNHQLVGILRENHYDERKKNFDLKLVLVFQRICCK